MHHARTLVGLLLSMALALLTLSGCASPARYGPVASPVRGAYGGKGGDVLAAGRAEMDESESTGAAGPPPMPAPADAAPGAQTVTLMPPREPSPALAKSALQAKPPVQTGTSSAAQAQQAAPHVSDMLIYTAAITMAVYQVEPGLEAVERVAREVGGYLAQRSDVAITIRVPRARFDEALHRVEASGDVLHREVSAEDVTDQYVEIETRLKNARSMRDRLEQLLARAGVKEAIEIEKELGRVTGEIESMEGKLKVLRDKIAYSTITVTFEPRGSGAVRDMPLRLPFPWLSTLGLPRLLSLQEGAR